MKRRVKRPVAQWAREVRKMRGGPLAGVHTIPFSTEFCPHVIEIMEACDDPSVRVIVNWAGIRDMKTTACLNAIGRTVTDDPGGIYSVHPTEDDFEKFEADDLEPMINLALESFFVQKKSRDSGRTKRFKRFKAGSIRLTSAGMFTGFRGSTVKVLCLHEVDGYEGSKQVESIYKALGRTKGIADAIIFLESTGTTAAEEVDGKRIYHSVIHEHYEKGDMRKWFCACQSCGQLQTLKYAQIRTATGDKADARYHCEACDFAHDEAGWFAMAQQGRWYPTAGLDAEQLADIAHTFHLATPKQPEVRSYWRNGFNSLLPKSKGYATKLHEFLAEGEAAKSSPEALKTWTNEIAAELWDENLIGEPPPEWKPLMDRAEPYATADAILVPSGALVLTGGGDVHPDRIEWTWLAFGRGETCWILDHVVTLGDTRDHGTSGPWVRLHHELQRTFEHASGGARMGLDLGMIDAGYGWDDVLKFIRSGAMAGKLRACRGASTFPAPAVSGYQKIVTGRIGQGTLMGHFVGTDAIKDTLYSRLRMIETPDGLPDGWIHFGKNLPQSYFEQLTAEKVEISVINGREERRYRKKAMVRNETTDTWVYAYGSFRRRQNWDWTALEAERMKSEEVDEPEEKPAAFMPPNSMGGFGTGWRL